MVAAEKVISQSGKVNCVENEMRKEMENDKLSKILFLPFFYSFYWTIYVQKKAQTRT